MRNFLLTLFIILGLASVSSAQKTWVGFSSQATQMPEVLVSGENTSAQLILDINISGMYVTEVVENGRTFQKLELEENATTLETGRPALPRINRIIGVPDNKLVRFTVLETSKVSLGHYLIYPFQTPSKDIKNGSPQQFVMDEAFYQSGKIYPSTNVDLDQPGIWRDVKICEFHYTPFNFNPASGELEAITHLRVAVEFYGNDLVNVPHRSKNITPEYFRMYSSKIINFNTLGFKEVLTQDTTINYLVITNTSCLATIQPLVDWKNKQGFKVKVKTMGTGFNTPQNFKDTIAQMFNNGNLEYVLMVGDAYPNGGNSGGPDDVPMFLWAPAGEDASYSDSWYTCLNGPDDHYADLAIGRFTYDTQEQLALQIQKTLTHYLNPDTTTNWPEHTLLVAHMEDYPGKYTQCKEEIRTATYTLSSPISQQCYGGAGATNADIINFVNFTSCGIFNYRGHGSTTEFWQWGNSGSFSNTHVQQLTNTNRLFVLFDVCCDNMDIVDYNGDCLCESFMKSPVASVAINGAIIPSYTIPNHDYDKEMYKAVYSEGIYNIGYITNFANITVLNVHGTLGRSNVRTYLWLGDASLEPWTAKPKLLTVTSQPQIFLGLTNFPVTVTSANGPVQNARVCVSNSDGTIYGVAFTDASGIATVQFQGPVQNPGNANLVVTAHNYLPNQQMIPVIPPTGPYVIKETYTISDPSGNNNGILDYGESVQLTLGVKNVGVATATNVVVTLSTTDPYITITDNTESYGSIAAGAVATVTNGFAFTAANNIPDGHSVLFIVSASDGSNTWTSNFSVTAKAPVLAYSSLLISDPSGNNNGKLDPGETVNMMVTVNNSGSSQATNVIGTLSSADPFITINTNSGTFGTLAAGGSAQQSFSVTAAPNTPAGHTASFDINFSASLGITGSGSFSTVVGQIPVCIIDLDPGASSGPAMQAALTANGISADYVTALPASLSLYSSAFVCLGIYSTNHQLTTTEGDQLANFLNSGGKVYMEGGDTWYYDPQTNVHPMFHITGVSDGGSDLSVENGQAGTITAGMSFTYSGENSWIDHISAVSPAQVIFSNQTPAYNTAVAYDAGTYKTIGASFEFGGLTDGSVPSTKTQLMHQYINFFGLNQVLAAAFSANNTSVCEGNSVNFSDMSIGGASSWNWTFPGGTPSTSTLQNPVITYNTSGTFDVKLVVSNANGSDSLTKAGYITVNAVPGAAGNIIGTGSLCAGTAGVTYSVAAIANATGYEWTVPSGATISNGNNTNTITVDFSASATSGDITVKGQNNCGEGTGNTLPVTVNAIPAVTLAPLANVCMNWPAFPLQGGDPAGGTYTGTGVSNNMFDPATAGGGYHDITYTYMSPAGCTNLATQTLFVDSCLAVINHTNDFSLHLFPNPSSGFLTLDLNTGRNETIDIRLFNELGLKVFEEKNIMVQHEAKLSYDWKNLSQGIYYLSVELKDQRILRKLVIE